MQDRGELQPTHLAGTLDVLCSNHTGHDRMELGHDPLQRTYCEAGASQNECLKSEVLEATHLREVQHAMIYKLSEPCSQKSVCNVKNLKPSRKTRAIQSPNIVNLRPSLKDL